MILGNVWLGWRPCTRFHVHLIRQYSAQRNSFYSVLGVEPGADGKEIKENFYRLSKKYHPDLNQDRAEALSRFKEVAEAYEVLSNPENRKAYDLYHGFQINKEKPSVRNRQFRRFSGMKGSFQNGRFVDEEGPPEMRNIQYDLSPEKMEKIWARYQERWNKREELERVRDLEKKKEIFRRKVEERRADMQNMTVEEKEDFLFKLRMLRPDADKSWEKEKVVEDGDEKDTAAGWIRREKEKVQQNMDWREKLRESIREKIEEEERMNRRTSTSQFQYIRTKNRETEEKDPFRQTSAERNTRGSDENRSEDAQQSDDDPLMKGIRLDDPTNFTDFVSQGFTRSRDTLEEMKTSRPFTYHQQSVKHGILHQTEVGLPRWVIVSALTVITLLVFSEVVFVDQLDKPCQGNQCDKR